MANRAWKIGKWVLVALGVVLAFVGYKAYGFFHIDTVRLDDKATVVLGGGGNTLILDSEEGPLVVDTKFMFPASQLKEAVGKISAKPVKMVISTHYHFDHTGGNPKYVGAEFVAGQTTPGHLLAKEADKYGPGKPGEKTLPTKLVDKSLTIHFGDEEIEVHFFGRGHTDGDVVVWLPKRRLLHMGDLFFNGTYPVFDPDGGASVREWSGAIEQALALKPDKIIPGHGPIATPADLQRFHDYLAGLWSGALAAVKAGQSKEQAAAAFDDSRFGLHSMMGMTSKDKNMATAFEEAKAWVAAGH